MSTTAVSPYAALPQIIPSQMNPPLTPVLVTDLDGIVLATEFLLRENEFGLDFETNVCGEVFKRKIRTIQFGNRQEQYVLDLFALAGWNKDAVWGAQGSYGTHAHEVYAALYEHIFPHFTEGKKIKVGDNLKFEYETLSWCFGERIWGLWDTLLAEKVLHCGRVGFFETNFWGLEDQVARYLKLQMDKTLQKSFGEFDGPLTQDQVNYCALDVRLPMVIRTGQLRELPKHGLMWAAQIEMDAIPAFGDLHLNGVYCDPEKWKALIASTEEQHNKNITEMDKHFIPVVGRKSIPPHDLEGLEKEWRDLGTDGEEELRLKAAITETKDKAGKDVLREQKKAAKSLREAQRKEKRVAFMKARKEVSEAKKFADACIGEAAINYGSPKQMKEALHKVHGLNEKTLANTNDKTLEKIAFKFPILAALQNFRETEKLLKGYGEQWCTAGEFDDPRTGNKKCGHVNPLTKRIHSNFDQLGADTGRTSSSSPNLQNIPKTKKFRQPFVARPGYKIITADWSGCELRILAEMSCQQSWIDAFNNEEDLHLVVCEMMHGNDFVNAIIHEPITKQDVTIPRCAYMYDGEGKVTWPHKQCQCPGHIEFRNKIKPMNFGIAYGLTAYGLAPKLKIEEEDAQKLISKYEDANSAVIGCLNDLGTHATTQFEARTLCGRRRLFDKPTYAQAQERAQEKYKRPPTSKEVIRQLKGMMAGVGREGRNHPFQGGNADLLKIALGCGADKNGKPFLWQTLKKYDAFLILEVHDEIVCEVREDQAAALDVDLKDVMERAGTLFVKSVKMESESHVEDCWTK